MILETDAVYRDSTDEAMNYEGRIRTLALDKRVRRRTLVRVNGSRELGVTLQLV